jgi:hypothetical protein
MDLGIAAINLAVHTTKSQRAEEVIMANTGNKAPAEVASRRVTSRRFSLASGKHGSTTARSRTKQAVVALSDMERRKERIRDVRGRGS